MLEKRQQFINFRRQTLNINEFWNNFLIWFESEGVVKLTSLTLVVVIGFVVVKLLLKFFKKTFSKTRLDNTVGDFLLIIIKYCLYLVWIMAMVSSLGISLTGFTVIATALSLGVSLALKNLLSNLVNGFVILSGKMFKEGDYIEVSDKEGEVKGIHILYTRLATPDNKIVSIPNSEIMTQSIINHCSEYTRRVDISLTISSFENVEKAKKILTEIFNNCEYKIKGSNTFVEIIDISTQGIILQARIWTSTENYYTAKFALFDQIYQQFTLNKISLIIQNFINIKNKQTKK